MTVTTRFAPSPTGYIHVGNLRTALFNHLIARKAGGTFILRLDDTDPERSKQEYADAIQQDLEWLGLTWDRLERQSDRLDRYAEEADRLRAAGEPTRLRILALLRGRDLSVGELVQVLSQSQPRLSHHLKALTSAGLVERMPEGSFVFYRAASRGEGRAFLDSLFGQIAIDSSGIRSSLRK